MESKKITANIPQVTSIDSSGRIIKEKPFKATCAEFLGMSEKNFQTMINKIK